MLTLIYCAADGEISDDNAEQIASQLENLVPVGEGIEITEDVAQDILGVIDILGSNEGKISAEIYISVVHMIL